MLNYRTLLIITGLVLTAQFVEAQRFLKEYNCPQNSLNVFGSTETANSFIINAFRSNGQAFADLTIDKSGQNPQFPIQQTPLFTTERNFIKRPDQSVLLFDRTENSSASLQLLDPAGNVLWNKTHFFTGDPNATDIAGKLINGMVLSDGFFILGKLRATYPNGSIKSNLYALKTDFEGNVIFESYHEVPWDLTEDIYDLTISGDRIYFTWVGTLADPSMEFITYVTKTGVWPATLDYLPPFNEVTGLAAHPDGGITAAGFVYGSFSPGESFGRAISLDSNFVTRWERADWPELRYLSGINNGGRYQPGRICSNGKETVISGYIVPANLSPVEAGVFLALLDSVGNISIARNYPHTVAYPGSLQKTLDGGYLCATYNYLNGGQVYIIKTDSALQALPNIVTGSVARDSDLSCTTDSTEVHLPNWIAALSSATDTVYAITNAAGTYLLQADTGEFHVSVVSFNPYWEPCENNIPVSFSIENQTDTVDFSVQAAVECPQMEVDITLPIARRCFDNTLYVRYCNHGTIAADSASIQVVLDPAMTFVSSQIPPTSQSGDTLTFAIGTVDINDCGQFTIRVNIGCNTTTNGQTACVSAHIFPDTFCLSLPAWSGGQLAVGGFCEQDSVVFWAKNVGTAATQQLDYVIIEDIVVWKEDSFAPLLPGETDTVKVKADGSTYGLLAEQEPGYPFNAFSPLSNGPSAWVEACNWTGSFSGGFITQFPNEDGNPVTATDCAVLVSSFDPNDKTASPQGVGDKHYILPGTPLEYLIRFQNTGTDTAFTVVVRDDLPPQLDPLSLEVLTSSHPYKVAFENGDILKFTFDHILLPDSNVNEAASHGFVKFRIRPRTDVPMGTLVENTAAIFFDFNPPVYTNTCFHTIDSNFLKTSGVWSPPVLKEKNGTAISPNPAGKHAVIRMIGRDEFSGMITICDVSGKPVVVVPAQNGKMQLPPALLPGCYFLKAEDGWVSQLMVM